jgi:diguanylate cyclase (GGDEF)-like protein
VLTLNAILLLAEAVIYFTVFAILFRLRHRFGFGVFVCALGTMHFLETYLAAILYVEFPAGVIFSPGSTILFAGKLAMLLLVYIREDAHAVRQPIYGLLIGNFLILMLALLLRQHQLLAPVAERTPDFQLMDDMGGMMVWGTLLLFVDAIAMILLYEKSASWFGDRVLLRIWLSLAVILTFDQVGFYVALWLFVDAPVNVLVGGWVGKMMAAAIYSALTAAYLRWGERKQLVSPANPRLADVFDTLTYRQRYERLLAESDRDALTGLLDRGRLDRDGPKLMAETRRTGRPLSVLIVDVDHFKSVNDRYGHAAGDELLRLIAARLVVNVRQSDFVYRYGGEELVVLCAGLPHAPALLAAEQVRRDIAAVTREAGSPVTISVGVATGLSDAADFKRLLAIADQRLYAAKSGGRDRVVGQPAPSGQPEPMAPAAQDDEPKLAKRIG